jgi:hypothetical protein
VYFCTGDEVPVGGARQGLLSELLGRGGKCEGYRLRFVGHSLGGAISALTGLRVRGISTKTKHLASYFKLFQLR